MSTDILNRLLHSNGSATTQIYPIRQLATMSIAIE